MRTIKSVFRKKLRSFLTIFGIAIGVFALVVMGGMAEKVTLLLDGGVDYFANKVIVSDNGALYGLGTPMPINKLDDLEKVPGVARGSAAISMLLDDTANGPSMGPPPLIMGVDGRARGYDKFKMTYKEGREIRQDDRGVAVVGCDLVEKLHAEVGKSITIKGQRFEVVGILDKTLTAPDNQVMIPLADAQVLFHKTLPEAMRGSIKATDLASTITLYPDEGVDAEKLAKTVGKRFPELQSHGPKAFEETIVESMSMISSIIVAVAMISLLVGGLSVVNTMMMSVSERTREVGIRRAIGASAGRVLSQFLAESAVVGAIGGALGLVLGVLVATVANAAGNASGTPLFLVTSRLAVGSLGFALCLGVFAGLYPAWHAARLRPVQALRSE
jgi:putative ABC transport system permease protein